MNEPRYAIVLAESDEKKLTIRDMGPWDTHPTITNQPECVVERLQKDKHLLAGMRLFYYDSEGDLDEIVIEDGEFKDIVPGPKRESVFMVLDRLQEEAGKRFEHEHVSLQSDRSLLDGTFSAEGLRWIADAMDKIKAAAA